MKRALSVLCVLLMLVSMFTVVALPTAAAATETLITNHFNFSTSTNCVLNGSAGQQGGTKGNNYFFTSDYIAVAAGETVYLGPARAAQGYQFYTYDASKNIVSAGVKGSALTVQETLIGADTADNTNDDIVIYKYTVPSNVAYLRVSTEAIFSRYFALTRNEVLSQASLMKYLTAKNVLSDSDNLFNLASASQARMDASSTTPVSTSEYYSTNLINVDVNDTIYFGPVNLNQGYQAVFFAGSATTGTQVKITTGYDYSAAQGNLKVVDTFKSGQAILAYRANQAGKLSVVLPIVYSEYYMVTKNKPFSTQALYNWQDSKPGNNLYFRELDAKGALGANGAYTATHYTSHAIKVNAGDKIVFGPASESQGYQLVTADINGGSLKTVAKDKLTNLGALSTFSTYQYSPFVLYEYTVPEGVSYVYSVNRPNVKEYFITLKNSSVNTPAEYYDYMGMNPNGNAVGKTALFVGDSICAAGADMKILTSTTNSFNGFANTSYNTYKMTGWAPRVAYWNQLASFTNNGVGGSSISDARIDTYGIITSQLEKSAGTAFDYVIIQGGINDADTKTPAGTVTEGFDPSKFDTSTFAGGLENTFYTAARLYGETAAIGYVFNYAIPTAKRPHVNGIMEEYFVVVKAACEKWGIPYLDLFHNEQVRKDLNLSVAGAPELPDQLHVSTKGYNIISPYISDFFATLTPYSSEGNTSSWIAMADILKLKAEELDAKYFTEDSFKAFKDTVASITVTDKTSYDQLVAARELLKQSNVALPLSLTHGGNAYYESLLSTEGTFAVESAADFAAMASLVNSGKVKAGVTFKQTADINLSGHANLMITGNFAATYDGGNHTIRNYTLSSGNNYTAMFNYLSGTIKNLTINNATVSGAWASAILVAAASGTTARVENVHIKNSTYNHTSANGGALLLAQPNTDNDAYTIVNCSVTNNVMNIHNKASNIGFLTSRGRTALSTITGCVISGNEVYVSKEGLHNFGYIAGEFEAGTVSDIVAVGNTVYSGPCDMGLFGRTKKGTINVSNVITQYGTVSGGTSEQPAATINTSNLAVVSSANITKNDYSADGIALQEGEILSFGPVKEGAAYLTFNGAEIPVSELYSTGRFGAGQVIYTFQAPAAGTAAFAKVDYTEAFIASKNTLMTVQTYYNYVDSLPGANAFNVDMDYLQEFRNDAGKMSVNKAHSSSHMIKVTAGETLSFGPAIPTQGYQGVTYTTEGLPVSTITASNYSGNLTTVTLPSGLVLYQLKIPEGIGYVELVNSTTMNSLYYAKHGVMTEADYNAYIGLDPETNPLYGKNTLFVGDSITHATQDAGGSGFNETGKTGWAIRIAAANGMKYMNGGVSGASLSTVRGTNRIINQLETYKTRDYDFVAIHGGVNDAWDNVAIGTVSDSFDPATFDNTTYAGGLEEAIYTAMKYYGDKATIFHIINFESPMHAKAGDSDIYFEVGRKICEKWGVPYVDLASNKELSNKLDIYTSGGAFVTDNIHPQPIGYDVIYPYIADFMKTLETGNGTSALDELKAQAAAVKAEDFTSSSYSAFTAAIATATTYENYVAAAALLVRDGDLALAKADNNTFYFAAIKGQKNFTVTSGADFNTLSNLYKNYTMGEVTVTQTADIDLQDYPNARLGMTDANPFVGVYDGKGYTISNVRFTYTQDNNGLFSRLKGTVKNFTIDGADALMGGWSGLVASRTMGQDALIENITVKNATLTKTQSNGMAVIVSQGAGNNDRTTVKNCVVTDCTIKSTMSTFTNFGYIVSRGLAGGLLVENCYAYGNTLEAAVSNYGAIVAEFEAGTIRNCGAFDNEITGSVVQLGGIVGQAKISEVFLLNCYTDEELALVSSVMQGEGAATVVMENTYTNCELADIQSGALAYVLKNATALNWVQSDYPTLFAGETVQRVTYKVNGEVVYTTYTDFEGNEIAPYAEEVEGLREWESATDANGDITYTAVLGHKNDLDGDGDLTVADVVYLLQYLVGYDMEIDSAAADMNGDNLVTIFDAILMLRALSV